jgi:hypothetical protein
VHAQVADNVKVRDARSDAEEAAAIVRRLLAAVEAAEPYADGPLGSGMVRQVQGAVAASEALAKDEDPFGPKYGRACEAPG